jgi:transposase
LGRHITTVQRYVRDFADEGMEGLLPERRGPKGQWKLTPDRRGKIGSSLLSMESDLR